MEEKCTSSRDEDKIDDFFGDLHDEDERGEPQSMADRELEAMNTRLANLGYQDGLEDGEGESAQEGFDVGYAVGAKGGWDAGLLYGGIAASKAALAQATNPTRRYNTKASAGPAQHGKAGGDQDEIHQHPNGDAGRNLSGVKSISKSNLLEDHDEEQVGAGSDYGARAALNKDLAVLLEDVKRAVLSGPDGPSVKRDKALHKLRCQGAPGRAVAEALRESCG